MGNLAISLRDSDGNIVGTLSITAKNDQELTIVLSSIQQGETLAIEGAPTKSSDLQNSLQQLLAPPQVA